MLHICWKVADNAALPASRILQYASHREEPILNQSNQSLEDRFMAADTNKCAMDGCLCTVPAGQKFCSAYCQAAKGAIKLECDCGHPCLHQSEAVTTW